MSARRIVVVGAGGSGIPLAVRLADAGHEVEILEAGPGLALAQAGGLAEALDDAWTVRAGLPDGPVTWTYGAELFPGRPWRIARGRLVGGSTAVNGAYFQRPHPDDFAGWAAVAGPEWSWAACLPALRRLETDLDFPDDPVHGAAGPMPVARTGGDDAVTRAFLAASGAVGAVAEQDKNAGGPSGAGLLPRNAVGARRWDVARSYAEGLAAASVAVRTGGRVERVRFRGARAVGVDIRDGEGVAFVPADEVVLCAGAIETPRLLLRSGVGDAAAIAPDAALVADLRGVGRGLSDHPALELSWVAHEGVRPAEPTAAWTAAWNAPADTVAASAVEYLAAVLPTAAILSGEAAAAGPVDLRMTLARPRSRGTVTLDDTAIRFGYLADAADVAALRDAVRTGARLLRTPEMATVVAEADIPSWVDGRGSDAAADEWIRGHLGTALHSCGTARMGDADDPDAVADAHGRVHGVEALRVADAALLPEVPSRGTALAAVMIGERIAELMAGE